MAIIVSLVFAVALSVLQLGVNGQGCNLDSYALNAGALRLKEGEAWRATVNSEACSEVKTGDNCVVYFTVCDTLPESVCNSSGSGMCLRVQDASDPPVVSERYELGKKIDELNVTSAKTGFGADYFTNVTNPRCSLTTIVAAEFRCSVDAVWASNSLDVTKFLVDFFPVPTDPCFYTAIFNYSGACVQAAPLKPAISSKPLAARLAGHALLVKPANLCTSRYDVPVLCKLLEPGQGTRRRTDCVSHMLVWAPESPTSTISGLWDNSQCSTVQDQVPVLQMGGLVGSENPWEFYLSGNLCYDPRLPPQNNSVIAAQETTCRVVASFCYVLDNIYCPDSMLCEQIANDDNHYSFGKFDPHLQYQEDPNGEGFVGNFADGSMTNLCTEGLTATVNFVCDKTAVWGPSNITQFVVANPNYEDCQFQLTIRFSGACGASFTPTNPTPTPTPGDQPSPVGWILMGLFVAGVLAYFLVGSLIQLARGRRGVEVIPNYEFWKQFPVLVVGGFKFVVDKVTCYSVKKIGSGGSNVTEYDKL